MTKCNEFSKFSEVLVNCKLLVWSQWAILQFWSFCTTNSVKRAILANERARDLLLGPKCPHTGKVQLIHRILFLVTLGH